jgi:hypothetical protein
LDPKEATVEESGIFDNYRQILWHAKHGLAK